MARLMVVPQLQWLGSLIRIGSSSTVADIGLALIAVLGFLLAFSPSIVLAQEIPEYDSQAHCERVAQSASKPEAALGRCLG